LNNIDLQQKFKLTTLDSGMIVISESIPHVRSISLGIWVNVGSRDENPRINGITHFIEHMLFKGTKTRTARDLAFEFDSFGADVNAFTSKENSCFYAAFIDENCPKALSLFSDMLINSIFSEKDLSFEKNVIFEEILMHEDNPSEKVHDLFIEALFDGHPLGGPIMGSFNTVREISKADIGDYFDQYYCSTNILIAAAGNLAHEELVEQVSKAFKNIAVGKPIDRQIYRPSVKSQLKIMNKKTEQSHICLGYEGIPIKSDERYALSVLSNIIGGGMSSRLFQEIRENKGLVYSIYSFSASFIETGAVYIYAGAKRENIREVVKIINFEIEKIRNKGFDEQEIARSKEQIKSNIVLGLEDTDSRMFRLGKSLLARDKILDLNEIIKRIDMVRSDDIMQLFNSIFVDERLMIAIIGNLTKRDEKYFEELMKGEVGN
jgi:predicted Zn-dependent peptidase